MPTDDQPTTSTSSETITEQMTEQMTATTTIEATAEAVFAVLADPSAHTAIDGTGWVRESSDGLRLTGQGQIFRMAMYHDNHPNGNYQMHNKVVVFDPPHAIAWEPGYDRDGEIEFGGWIWRYDMRRVNDSRSTVTLTYDWSGVPKPHQLLPFAVEHLQNSLRHLADLATHTR
jgi:uncharacterized protein YndB with AHSA1/START domain